MRTIAVFVTTLFFTLFTYSLSGEVTTINGQITDSEGAAIANARVLVHWDSAGSTVGLADNVGLRHDLIVFTDDNGNYSANVPPGFYDLFVSSMAFTPIAIKVRVKKNVSSTFKGRLHADTLVTRELGHEVYSVPQPK